MRTASWILGVVLLVGALARPAVQGDRPQPRAAGNANPAQIRRGEYLVNQVARCGDCHTPRDARGRPDLTRQLQGAKIWFTPRVRPRKWEDHAPDITRSGKGGRWSEAKMVRYLSTGKEAEPPMPAYHLSVEDAKAVTAYLRSLPGKKQGGRKRRDDDDD